MPIDMTYTVDDLFLQIEVKRLADASLLDRLHPLEIRRLG
jgi:hypothetical protein